MADKTLNERVRDLEDAVRDIRRRLDEFETDPAPGTLRIARKKPQRAYPEDLVDAPN